MISIEKIRSAFPANHFEDWEKQVKAELGEEKFASLFRKTQDGITLHPYYTSEHVVSDGDVLIGGKGPLKLACLLNSLEDVEKHSQYIVGHDLIEISEGESSATLAGTPIRKITVLGSSMSSTIDEGTSSFLLAIPCYEDTLLQKALHLKKLLQEVRSAEENWKSNLEKIILRIQLSGQFYEDVITIPLLRSVALDSGIDPENIETEVILGEQEIVDKNPEMLLPKLMISMTSQAVAAYTGGADILAYTLTQDEKRNRMLRNIVLILKHESFCDERKNYLTGSYLFEQAYTEYKRVLS